MITIHPWQKKQWNLLVDARKNNRLPHALLFTGAQGLGKTQFAEALAAAILCEHAEACGTCHSCGLVRAKSHPDLLWIIPEQAGQMIKIDQIRNVVSMANETSMQGGHKVIIINPAHAMNPYAANALLKTLEEAAPKTLFILISEQNLRLPLTIKSRCQKVVFQIPEKHAALTWLRSQVVNSDIDLELVLKVAEGAPLSALAIVEKDVMTLRQTIYSGLSDLNQSKADPLQLAAEWQEHDVALILTLLLFWLRDLLRLQLTHSQAVIVNEDYRTVFSTIMQRLSHQHVLRYIELVQERYAHLLNLQNVNRQLLLEEVLISISFP